MYKLYNPLEYMDDDIAGVFHGTTGLETAPNTGAFAT